MDKQFLCLDSPTDFMVGKYISADELKEFINIPCKIKAGVFILCMEGQIRSTINMSELTTSKHDGLSTDDLQVADYKNIPKQGQPDHELLRASLSICRISRYLEQ